MAVRYRFECPDCNSSVELTTTQAGQEMTCSSCQSTFSAPRLGDIKNLPIADGSPAASTKTRDSGFKSASPLKGWLFAGGLLLAAIAGIGGYFAQDYAKDLRVDFDIEETIAKEFKSIDEAPLVEIYGIVVQACEESFQLEYREAEYRTRNIKSGIMQKIAWGCWAACGAGLLMLLSSLFVKK